MVKVTDPTFLTAKILAQEVSSQGTQMPKYISYCYDALVMAIFKDTFVLAILISVTMKV